MRRYIFPILIAVLAFTFLPWLGDTLFNTKGEPREAIVALSMIQSGDYILPVSCGGDIPYKPPFLAWLIVMCSWLTGSVNEFASRLPSAIATIAMAIGVFLYFRRRSSDKWPDLTAALTAGITVTAFEVFRAASACRVDMVLTACIVGAVLLLARRRDIDGRPGISVWAIVLMACAVLTKGPVGMVLPCLIAGLYFLFIGDRFWRSFGVLAFCGVMSLTGYIVWFHLALISGGQEFADLMWEENIGRMTGTMSYESHVNPFYYNFITIIAGMVPYTLLAIFALFAPKYKSPRFRNMWHDLRSHSHAVRLAVTAVVVTLVFYTIPASKRSVYLLPLYPFLSYLVARLTVWLVTRKSKVITVYGSVMAVLALLLPLVLTVVNAVDFPSLAMKLKPESAAMLEGLHDYEISFVGWICILTSAVAGVMTFTSIKKMKKAQTVVMTMFSTFAIYWVLSSTVMPAVLNTKSDIRLARVVSRYVRPDETVYTYVHTPMLRFYTAGFYLDDRVVPIQGRTPSEGYLLVGERDMEEFIKAYGDRYAVSTVYTSPLKSCDIRQKARILHFKQK